MLDNILGTICHRGVRPLCRVLRSQQLIGLHSIFAAKSSSSETQTVDTRTKWLTKGCWFDWACEFPDLRDLVKVFDHVFVFLSNRTEEACFPDLSSVDFTDPQNERYIVLEAVMAVSLLLFYLHDEIKIDGCVS